MSGEVLRKAEINHAASSLTLIRAFEVRDEGFLMRLKSRWL